MLNLGEMSALQYWTGHFLGSEEKPNHGSFGKKIWSNDPFPPKVGGWGGKFWKNKGHPSDILLSLFFFASLAGSILLIVDADFLLTIGSFLLTVEHPYLQLTTLAFLLAAGAFSFSLTILAFLLTQLELFCLQWESASNKRLKGL